MPCCKKTAVSLEKDQKDDYSSVLSSESQLARYYRRMQKDSSNCTISKSVLNKELVAKYENLRTPSLVDLASCIAVNVFHPSVLEPRVASKDCLKTYPLFWNRVMSHLGHTRMQKGEGTREAFHSRFREETVDDPEVVNPPHANCTFPNCPLRNTSNKGNNPQKGKSKQSGAFQLAEPSHQCCASLGSPQERFHSIQTVSSHSTASVSSNCNNSCTKTSLSQNVTSTTTRCSTMRPETVILYTELSILRNLAKYELPGNISCEDQINLQVEMSDLLANVFKGYQASEKWPLEWHHNIELQKVVLENLNEKASRSLAVKCFQPLNNPLIDVGILVNGEDHIQLVASTRNRELLNECATRIVQCLTKTELAHVPFAMDKCYGGYLTTNPRFLGTGVRVRSVVKLPFSLKLPDFEECYLTAGNFYIPLAEKETGLCVLENSNSFWSPDNDALGQLKYFNSKLRELAQLEEELVENNCYSGDWDGMPVEKLTTLSKKLQESNHVTYARKHYLRGYTTRFEKVRTSYGGQLAHCIRVNALYPEILFPRACDAECYEKFNSYFDKILLDCNQVKHLYHPRELHFGRLAKEKQFPSKVISIRVRFVRNLCGYPFAMLMSLKMKKEVESKIIAALESVKKHYQGRYFSLETKEGMKFWEKAAKMGLAPQLNDRIKRATGVYRHWPKCRGIYAIGLEDTNSQKHRVSLHLVDPAGSRTESQSPQVTPRHKEKLAKRQDNNNSTEDPPKTYEKTTKDISLKSYFTESRFNPKLLVIINDEDHLKVVCQDSRMSCTFTRTYEAAFNLLNAITAGLGGAKAFSHSPELGFLSPRPHEVGTGMRVSAKVQLTKLTSELHRLDYMCRLTRLQYRGTMGDGCIIKDKVVEISLKRKMGLSEAAQVDEFLRGLNRILDEDESCKDKPKSRTSIYKDGSLCTTD